MNWWKIAGKCFSMTQIAWKFLFFSSFPPSLLPSLPLTLLFCLFLFFSFLSLTQVDPRLFLWSQQKKTLLYEQPCSLLSSAAFALLPIHPPIYPPMHPFIHLSTYPSRYPPIHLSIHPFNVPSYRFLGTSASDKNSTQNLAQIPTLPPATAKARGSSVSVLGLGPNSPPGQLPASPLLAMESTSQCDGCHQEWFPGLWAPSSDSKSPDS